MFARESQKWFPLRQRASYEVTLGTRVLYALLTIRDQRNGVAAVA